MRDLYLPFVALIIFCFLFAVFIFCFSSPILGETQKTKKLSSYTLIDQNGKKIQLNEFQGKPLVVSFIYIHCSQTCPAITANLQKVAREGENIQSQFNILTISFDPENDTPGKLKLHKNRFANEFKNWQFATSDKKTVEKLADELKFYYKKVNNDFEHTNLVTILDKDGKIYRQVYGTKFSANDVLFPVKELLYGKNLFTSKTLNLVERVALFCYRYDQNTNSYKFDYGLLSALITGSIMQGITIIWMIRYFLHKKSTSLT